MKIIVRLLLPAPDMCQGTVSNGPWIAHSLTSNAAASKAYNLVSSNPKNKFSYTGSLGACPSLLFGLDSQQETG